MLILAASAVAIGPLLTDLLYVFGLAALLVALLHLRRLPSLLGFLITGVLLGPAGFGVISDPDAIAIMAEFGVVLLMFTIGVEVSLKDLIRMGRQVLGGGALQMGLTFLIFALGFAAVGYEFGVAAAMGLLIAASSTALVLRILGDRGELGTPHGQLSLSILLFQDFAVVALMLVLPMMAGEGLSPTNILLGLGQAVLVTVGIFVAAKVVMPFVLKYVVELRSREVFLLATIAAIFGTAWVADLLGLSLALGAFLAGLVVSESEFSHQMFAEVLPFRDVFNGLFFVSIGLLIKPEVVWGEPEIIGVVVAATLLFKFAVVFGVARVFRLSFPSAVLAGVSLAQIGEFGLVLAQQAAGLELITEHQHSIIIAVSVVTMGITPLAIPLATAWAERRAARSTETDQGQIGDFGMSGHVIIVGFGLNGQNVARALKRLGVPFVAVEMNRSTVEAQSAEGVPIVLGNATRPALLHHLHVEEARVLVSAIADAAATREIVASAHNANPELLVVARTRYVSEIEPLRKLGADVVIPEEFETSIELVASVMKAYGAPDSVIFREKRVLRSERYRLLLEDAPEVETETISELFAELEVHRLPVSEADDAVGCTLGELNLRAATGTTVVAVMRSDDVHATPDAGFELRAGDVLVVVGDAPSLRAARGLLADLGASGEDLGDRA